MQINAAMHIGHSCGTKNYMEDASTRKELESVQEERDLGVITTADLKSSSQCTKSGATARKVIGMIRRKESTVSRTPTTAHPTKIFASPSSYNFT